MASKALSTVSNPDASVVSNVPSRGRGMSKGKATTNTGGTFTSRDMSTAGGSLSQLPLGERTWKSLILSAFARGDLRQLVEGISMFPFLKFTDQSLENKFWIRNNKIFPPRMYVAAAFTGAVVPIYWAIVATGIHHETDYLPRSLATAMHIFFSLILVNGALFFGVPYFKPPFVRKYLEVYAYFGVGLFLGLFFGWTMYGLAILEVDTDDPLLGIALAFEVYRIKFWSDAIFNCFFVNSLIALDLLLPTRTKYSWAFHVYAFAILTTYNLYPTLKFGDTLPLVRTMVNQIIFFFVTCLFCFGARYYREIQERVELFQHVRNLDKIQTMREAMKNKAKKAGGSTAVEEIIAMLQKVQFLIDAAFETTRNQDLREAGSILLESVSKLSTSENLYSLKVQDIEGDQRASIMQVFEAFGEVRVKPQKSVRFHGGESQATERSNRVGSGSRRLGSLAAMAFAPDSEAVAELQSHASRSIAEVPSCVLGEELTGKVGVIWDYNLIELAKQHPNIIMECGSILIADKMETMGCGIAPLYNLLYDMQKRYFANPYHNAVHAACVAHTTVCLTRLLDIPKSENYDAVDDVVTCIAALGHDVAHPGRNNAFFVSTYHPLAVVYNDVSVLENFHSTVTFNLIGRPENNVFSALMPDTFRTCRSRVIDLILATDMKQHFEGISRFRVRRGAADFDHLTNVDDQWLTLRMCIKAGDLSHAAMDWPQHLEWSLCVVEEFYKQGDEEERLGLPKSPLCDREGHQNFAKSQKGFIEFVVQPLYKELEEVSINEQFATTCLMRMLYNKSRWEDKAKDESTVAILPAIAATPTHVNESAKCFFDVLQVMQEDFSQVGPAGYMSAAEKKKAKAQQKERKDILMAAALAESTMAEKRAAAEERSVQTDGVVVKSFSEDMSAITAALDAEEKAYKLQQQLLEVQQNPLPAGEDANSDEDFDEPGAGRSSAPLTSRGASDDIGATEFAVDEAEEVKRATAHGTSSRPRATAGALKKGRGSPPSSQMSSPLSEDDSGNVTPEAREPPPARGRRGGDAVALEVSPAPSETGSQVDRRKKFETFLDSKYRGSP